MKLLFWNIGPDPDANQLDFVKDSIAFIDVDVVCIAEGTPDEPKCVNLVNSITGIGYNSFYDPTFYKTPSISNQYGYQKLGLKLFEKPTSYKISSFSFADQAVNGRILYYRFSFNGTFYSCFFVHNKSMAGDYVSQNDFMVRLKMCIDSKRLLHKKDKVFVIGDFNLEPWDDLLHHTKTIRSYFSSKRFDFYKVWGAKNKYFNPFYEYIQTQAKVSLQGTFNNDNHCSLIDFALFAGDMTNYNVEIINSIDGDDLLIQNNTKITLLHGFDHLPIQITLN